MDRCRAASGIVAVSSRGRGASFSVRSAAVTSTVKSDDAWATVSENPLAVVQPCPPHSWPANVSHVQCSLDMGENGSAAALGSADGCAMACCTNPRCAVWQWAPPGSSGGSGCWIGHEQPHGCHNNSDWVGGSRVPPDARGPPPPPPPPSPQPAPSPFPHTASDNPLAGLPALAKPHYSWCVPALRFLS